MLDRSPKKIGSQLIEKWFSSGSRLTRHGGLGWLIGWGKVEQLPVQLEKGSGVQEELDFFFSTAPILFKAIA